MIPRVLPVIADRLPTPVIQGVGGRNGLRGTRQIHLLPTRRAVHLPRRRPMWQYVRRNDGVALMSSPRDVRSFSIHFDREDADAHVLPAAVLIESIARIQRIVLLLAKMHRGEPLGQRISFSRVLRGEFALLCHLPEAGSYAVPVEVGHQPEEVPVPGIMEVCELFHRVTRAVGGEDAAGLRELVPDPQYLARLRLRPTRHVLPSGAC